MFGLNFDFTLRESRVNFYLHEREITGEYANINIERKQ